MRRQTWTLPAADSSGSTAGALKFDAGLPIAVVDSSRRRQHGRCAGALDFKAPPESSVRPSRGPPGAGARASVPFLARARRLRARSARGGPPPLVLPSLSFPSPCLFPPLPVPHSGVQVVTLLPPLAFTVIQLYHGSADLTSTRASLHGWFAVRWHCNNLPHLRSYCGSANLTRYGNAKAGCPC